MFKHWENVEKIEPMLRGKNKEALEQVRKETSRTTLFPSWPSFLFADEQNMKHVAPQSAIYGEAGRRLRPKLSRQKWNVQQWLARWTNLHNKNEWQSPDVKWKAIGTRDSPVAVTASYRLQSSGKATEPEDGERCGLDKYTRTSHMSWSRLRRIPMENP